MQNFGGTGKSITVNLQVAYCRQQTSKNELSTAKQSRKLLPTTKVVFLFKSETVLLSIAFLSLLSITTSFTDRLPFLLSTTKSLVCGGPYAPAPGSKKQFKIK